MQIPLFAALLALAVVLTQAFQSASAGQFDTQIPMTSGGAATFYVEGRLGDLETTRFMVDTGSGFMTINQGTLDQLLARDLARYERDLSGILADGTELQVPIYRISRFSIGEHCVLENVEAALFPSQRQILGLNVLNRASPFIFSANPPELVLSHCTAGALSES